MTSLSFTLISPSSKHPKFTPRLGRFTFKHAQTQSQTIDTPGFLLTTSRGVVSHLSRDHLLQSTPNTKWLHVPFESFLEHTPPILTKVKGENPVHGFLGFDPERHLVSVSLRDPANCDEIPPNGKDFVAAKCVRGVRKVTVKDWKSHIRACQPSIVFALSDTLLTPPPHSQKRITKSIERSTAWLLDILSTQSAAPSPNASTPEPQPISPSIPNVFVHMAGGPSLPARQVFSQTLMEKVYGKEKELVHPLECLDDGVKGYVFDLAPMRAQVVPDQTPEANLEQDQDKRDSSTTAITELIRASLDPVPSTKIRLANSVATPHEALRLISGAGIDLFDSHWAQRAADIGVALNFTLVPPQDDGSAPLEVRRHDLGLNLYHNAYTHDFSTIFDSNTQCPCLTCSPTPPSSFLPHSSMDEPSFAGPDSDFPPPKGFTRAYIHHLLHTHEMSAHTLLVLHNIAVLERFFVDIRALLRESGDVGFEQAVKRFCAYYDEGLKIFQEARIMWDMVDKARGKGRLAREAEKADAVTV